MSDTINPPSGPYTVTIQIDPVDDLPTLAVISPVTVYSYNVATFTAVATDPDIPYADTLTYSLEGTPPAGAAIDPVTGVFTWKAILSSAHLEIIPITVIVSDATLPTSLTAQRTVSITIKPLPIFLSLISSNQ